MGIKDFIGRHISDIVSNHLPTSAAKEGVSSSDMAIINQIVGEYIDRARKKIKNWRSGMELAEDIDDPRWYEIQDLFEDTIDAHLSSVIDIRKMATTNHRSYVIDKNSKKQLEEQTNFLDKRWFFDFIDEALNAILKKFTPVQIIKGDEFPEISVIPRRNICPQKRRIYTEVSGSKYLDIDDFPDFILINHSSKFGILNDVMPNCIWKKNALQAWAEFSERFGMPLISATTASKQDIPRIQAMLKKMGEAAQAVLPHGTTVEVHDLANAGNPKSVYDGQATFHDNQISKRILGGTMVTDNGSSRSQSEVHERTLDDKLSIADQRFIRFVVNDQLFPILQSLGYPFDNSKMSFMFDETEELSLSEHWKIVSDASEKFEFDNKGVEWIAKTFNIPIKGIKKTTNSSNSNSNFNAATAMRAMAVACSVTLPDYDDGHNHHHPTAEGVSKSLIDQLNSFDEQIEKHLYNNRITDAERERLLKSKRIAEELRTGLFEGWKNRLGVDWNAPDNRALAAMEMNLLKFSEAKGRAEVLLLNRLLIDKEKNQIRNERDFIEQAKKVNGVFNETYLVTERDFAIATGQNSARYMEFINEKNQISKWEYQTVGDDHVRAEHAALDGRIFNFDDTEARKLWPPNGYKCRCEGIQFVGNAGNNLMSGKDALSVIFPIQKQKDLFAFNRAEAGVVFSENQMYLETLKDIKGQTSVGKQINDYTFSDYGLKKFSELRKTLESLKLDKTITPGNVGELFSNNAGTNDFKAMGFNDYLKRKIILKEKAFKTHTSGKYIQKTENRHQLFAHVADILKNPSEVYMRDVKDGQFRYVKFYKDKTIVIDTDITKDGLELKTWYENKIGDDIRKGLWVK